MAYGLQVTSFDAGGNPITQIDTELGLTNYVVTNAGRGTQVNLASATSRSRFILVKPIHPGTTTTQGVYVLGSSNGTATIKFVDTYLELWADDGMPYNTAYLPQQVDYLVVEDVTGVAPVGDYGLQTVTAGGESSFDSRKIKLNTSFDITSVIPKGALGGGGGVAGDLITTDLDTYISLSPWSFWDDPRNLSGLRYKTYSNGSIEIFHHDVMGDEPVPTEPDYGVTFNDNYTTILLADKT